MSIDQSTISSSSRNRILISTALLTVLALLISGITVVIVESNRLKTRQIAAARVAAETADEINERLSRSLSATYALAAVVRQGNGEIAEFDRLANDMLRLYGGISSLQLAPNGIVTTVVPLAGNEKAIGHNLLEDTRRNKEALLALRTRALTLAGPFELIQGGVAIIGRLPVYLSDPAGQELFWGFTIAMIRVPELLRVADIQRLADQGFCYQLSRIHPDSGERQIFASGGGAVNDPLLHAIEVPNGTWTLAVAPIEGWYSPLLLAGEITIALLFTLGIATFFSWILRQPFRLQQIVQERTAQLTAANAQLQQEIHDREFAQREQLAAQKELTVSEERFRSIMALSPDIISIIDSEGKLVYNSPAARQIHGYTQEEMTGLNTLELIHPEDQDAVNSAFRQLITAPEQTTTVQYRYLNKDGSFSWMECRAINLSTNPHINGILAISRNIDERKSLEEEHHRLEQQMLHAQKLESLGVLAGGIAHDFNNILTAIIGNADLALMRISRESPAVENLHRIEQAAERAADLAGQMLAYSGKGKFIVESVDLNRLVEEMGNMLEVSISKKAVLRYNLARPLPPVNVDVTQIRQIVMNLVINASEAIGDKSGIIAISTGSLECDEIYLRDAWLTDPIPEGVYVFIEVADTGCGMDDDTLSRIFDPFFTTKFTGRGLGMAAVLGIIRGHNGAIKVHSEPGNGSRFKVLLPAGGGPGDLFTHEAMDDIWNGPGVALLVDDEETVRAIGAEMLQELGVKVVTASDGREALERFKANPDISVVILDLTMPHLDGEQCFRELRRLNPDVKVIISSGFSEHEVAQRFAGLGLTGFIQKPYKLSALKQAL